MSPFNPNQASAIEVGNDAGWVLQFHNVDSDGTIADEPAASVRSDDYYAAIEAHLQDGLVGGAYTIMIEGLIDQDYQTISQARSGRPVVAKLYMFWNDTVAGPVSYLRNIAGLSAAPSPAGLQRSLVAVLHVYNVKRKLGKLTYDTEIKGIEWAYYAMLQPLPTKLAADFYRSVCLDIYDRTQVLINTFPEPDDSGRLTVDAAGKKSSEKVSYPEGKTYGAILTGIANAVQKNRKTYGHSMLLIRDGRIYLGPRPFPLEGDVKALTASTGLLNAVVDGLGARSDRPGRLRQRPAVSFHAHPQGPPRHQAGRRCRVRPCAAGCFRRRYPVWAARWQVRSPVRSCPAQVMNSAITTSTSQSPRSSTSCRNRRASSLRSRAWH